MAVDINLDYTADDPLRDWANKSGFTVMGEGGLPIGGDHENALRALVWLGFHTEIRLDEWTGRIEIRAKDNWEQFDGYNHVTTIKIAMEQEYKRSNRESPPTPYVPTRASVDAAITYAASANPCNARVDMIKNTTWDNRDRFPDLAKALQQDPDDELSLEIARLLVNGIVVRAVRPGSDFPYCPIIYSPDQGVGKGYLLKVLSDEYHAELHEGVFSAPNALQMLVERFRGKSVVELGEFNGLRPRSQDVLKSVITDGMFSGVRLAYGREARDWPMTAIMVGTTNSENVLTDHDNRRHPVLSIPKGTHINIEWVRENVQQLWAQAYAHYEEVVYEYTESAIDAANWGTQVKNTFMDMDADIVVGRNGNIKVQIPARLWSELSARATQFRQVNPIEEWLEIELEKFTDGRIKGMQMFDLVKAKFGRVDSRVFADAMNACGWQKRRITTATGKVNAWETSGATGDPVDPTNYVSLIPV